MLSYIKKKLFRGMELYDISLEELMQKQIDGAIVIDVRSIQEFSEGHLEGAVNIPYYDIVKKIDKICPNKAKEIVVYCGIGARSKRAYKILKKLQNKNVYNLYGFIDNWQ